MNILTKKFYNHSPLLVAPKLLGKIVVRLFNSEILSGRIVEVEAYLAEKDAAAHSYKGKTKRNQSLFLPAGHLYVHSIHQQNCIDIVTEEKDVPTSVLIRALEPLAGIKTMQELRKKEKLVDLTSGPGKLCQALAITKELDGIDLTNKNSGLFLADDGYKVKEICKAKRVGISKAQALELRFYIKDSPYVSKK